MSTTSGKGKAKEEEAPVQKVEIATYQQPLAIVKPKPFSGKEEDVELFIIQLRTTFRLQKERFPDDQTKALYAFSLMEGEVLKWAKAHLTNYYQYCTENGWAGMDPMTRRIILEFMDLAVELRSVFGTKHLKKETAAKLFALTQTKGLNQYTAEFLNKSWMLG